MSRHRLRSHQNLGDVLTHAGEDLWLVCTNCSSSLPDRSTLAWRARVMTADSGSLVGSLGGITQWPSHFTGRCQPPNMSDTGQTDATACGSRFRAYARIRSVTMGGHRASAIEGEISGVPFRKVLRVRVFAVLYAAETQSTAGDQLARIALSILVFDRTKSVALTAVTYGVTYLPGILGGSLLARVGDRAARKDVMVACDLCRGALFACMALPGMPLAAMWMLLVVAVLLAPVFSAAQVTYLSTALVPSYFRSATGLRMVTNQLAQAAGFAIGGALVVLVSPRGALGVDAASYAVSACIIGAALRRDRGEGAPAARQPTTRRPSPRRFNPWTDRHVRALLGLSCLAGFFVVPEGLAVPFGDHLGASAAEIGVLIASIPLGGALGAIAFVRFVPAGARAMAADWMAVGCGAPLIVAALVHSWPIALACWLLSGMLAAYQIEIMTSLVYMIPNAIRTRFVGIASAGLLGAQGVGVAVFGGIAELTTPAHAIGMSGAIGTVAALSLVLGPLRALPSDRPAHLAHPPQHQFGTRVAYQRASEASTPPPEIGVGMTERRGGHTMTKRTHPAR